MTGTVTPTQEDLDLASKFANEKYPYHSVLSEAFARHRLDAIATQAAEIARLREALTMANAHIARMQDMMVAYLTPGPYREQTGDGASASEGDPAHHFLFACDMIYMLDGPEQRALEAAIVATQPSESVLPDDVVRLVIAARTMAFGDWFGEGEEWEVARKELDDAAEAFASRVEWPDTPSEQEGGE